MTQSNPFQGVMAFEVFQNEEISGEGKNGEKKSRFCYPSEKSEQGKHKSQEKRARKGCLVRC